MDGVEARRPLGFDAALANNTNVVNGVLIHMASSANVDGSYLLDLTPATTNWLDPGLVVGQSYVDAAASVTITPAWVNNTNAGVTISMTAAACVRGTPTLALTPAQSQWVAPGTMVTYTATVTNADSLSCSPSTFTVQATAPSGWTKVVVTPSFAVAPGGTASTSVRITSPSSAASGFYTITVTATDTAPQRSASKSATYVVSALPNVSVTADRTSYSTNRSETATIKTTVLSNGSPVSGASVNVSVTRSNGTKSTWTVTTATDGTATIKDRLSPQDPAGTYQVKSTATVNGTLNGTATTSFLVVQ
jgi:hypothetical protein